MLRIGPPSPARGRRAGDEGACKGQGTENYLHRDLHSHKLLIISKTQYMNFLHIQPNIPVFIIHRFGVPRRSSASTPRPFSREREKGVSA